MEPGPIGKRTRLQTTLKLRRMIQEQKRARRDAKREWEKKKLESLGVEEYNFGDEEEEIEVLDKSEYEKRVEASGSKDEINQVEENSDDSLQILGDSWNPLNDDECFDDSDNDDGNDNNDVNDDVGTSHNSNMDVVPLDSDGEKGNSSRVLNFEERIELGFGESEDNEDSSGEEYDNEVSNSESFDDDDDDDDGYDDDGDDGDDVNDGDYADETDVVRRNVGQKKKTRKISDLECEKRAFEGLVLTAHPDTSDIQTPSLVRKRTRSRFKPKSKKKLGDGTIKRPVLIDVDDDGNDPLLSGKVDDIDEEEDDEDEEEEENGGGYGKSNDLEPRRRGESGRKRKRKRERGRPSKTKEGEDKLILKKKPVKGLKNSELQKVFLNTLSDNGNSSLDDFMSSLSNFYLPLKFKFGEKVSSPPPKSPEDEELDELWKELDFALGICNIASDSSCLDDKNHVNPPDSPDSQKKRCADGKHDLVLDEEVGIICRCCSFVNVEIKYVTPEFNKDPFGKAENTGYGRFSYHDDIMNKFKIPEPIAGHGPIDETRGTVWDLIPGIKNTLYPHQQEGFEFMWRNISGGIKMEELGKPTKFGLGGCIICHAPGTGKTRLAIVFLQSYIRRYPKSRPVILAPKSVLLTWEEEFSKWKTDIPFLNMGRNKQSGKEDPMVLNVLNNAERSDLKTIRLAKLIIWKAGLGVLGLSYELFESFAGQRKGTGEDIRKALLEQCGLLVMDEGHRPRNDSSLIWKVLTNVATKNRIILSGTPFQNNFKELYNTISLVREEFVDPLLSGCYGSYPRKHARKNNEWRSRNFGDSERQNAVEEKRRIEDLRNRIKPFVHIYERQDLIPCGLFHSVLVLKPSDLQKHCFKQIEGLNFLDKDHLVSLTSVHPSLLEECEQVPHLDRALLRRHIDDLDAGVKIRFLFELIKLSRGERVLVFSQRLPTLVFIGDKLKSQFRWSEDREVLYMDGKQEDKKRLQSIRLFNDPKSEARVFLASIRACCEGIHLVGASRVVLLDVAWNPFVERQAISRAYRLGQEKDVYVYHLIASDTHEADKYYRQVRKERLSEMVFCPSERENVTKMNPSSTGKEDQILEEMIQHEKLKHIFMKIIYQPDAQKVIDSIYPLNLGGCTD